MILFYEPRGRERDRQSEDKKEKPVVASRRERGGSNEATRWCCARRKRAKREKTEKGRERKERRKEGCLRLPIDSFVLRSSPLFWFCTLNCMSCHATSPIVELFTLPPPPAAIPTRTACALRSTYKRTPTHGYVQRKKKRDNQSYTKPPIQLYTPPHPSLLPSSSLNRLAPLPTPRPRPRAREELGQPRPAVLDVVLLQVRGLDSPGGEAEGEAGLEHEGQPALELGRLGGCKGGGGSGCQWCRAVQMPTQHTTRVTPHTHTHTRACTHMPTHANTHTHTYVYVCMYVSPRTYLELLAGGLKEGVGVGAVRAHARVERGAARDEALLGVVPGCCGVGICG